MQVLDEQGKPRKPGEVGALAASCRCRRAVPTLWNADERFGRPISRLSRLLQDGDAGFIDEDGYVSVMTRIDDVINVAGHRLSTGEIEEVLASHDDVAECAVIGIDDELKGQVPFGFLVLKAGVDRRRRTRRARSCRWCATASAPSPSSRPPSSPRLPKTRSGKILRGTMQKIADGQPWKMPATIDDPAAIEEITGGLKTAGYASKG